ncbi:CHAD domain-containing protein [Niastella caeni]|uniref:CHAD domain-containing protein n=1 Tax=Niastella caeni TaxID=2569763 RepID=A0A4S8HZT0_9BACT|nr:CHAD domain-containing protein [Niastella caeni]THU41323.1 CHAD domain-containing protein [Niastella caeni]
MKRRELEEVVIRHSNHLEKFCNRLPGSFEQEDIHDLRVEYKKTRAFLRLLQLEKDAGDLKIPDKLKAIYHAGGKVRDMQLFLAELYGIGVAMQIPSSITHWCQQLFISKEQMVAAIEAVQFKKILNGITKELPRQLHDETLHKFMHQKIAAIHIVLLAADNENDLHIIRKQLKDIIYTIRVYEQDWGIPFPIKAWQSETQLNDMAGSLGDFNDRCGAISLLQAVYSDSSNDQEKIVLQDLHRHWLHLKEAQQRDLLQQVRTLNMEHSF